MWYATSKIRHTLEMNHRLLFEGSAKISGASLVQSASTSAEFLRVACYSARKLPLSTLRSQAISLSDSEPLSTLRLVARNRRPYLGCLSDKRMGARCLGMNTCVVFYFCCGSRSFHAHLAHSESYVKLTSLLSRASFVNVTR